MNWIKVNVNKLTVSALASLNQWGKRLPVRGLPSVGPGIGILSITADTRQPTTTETLYAGIKHFLERLENWTTRGSNQ